MVFTLKGFNKFEAHKLLLHIQKWFEDNPRKKVCHLPSLDKKIRRENIKEDILSLSLPGVVI